MNKIIAIPAIAALAIIGLAACTAPTDTATGEPTTQSEPKPKPPVVTDAPDGITADQWELLQEAAAEVGFSDAETADVVDSVVYVWATEDMSDVCNYLYTYGEDATIDAILTEAYDGTTPYDWSTVWAVATGVAIDNNC